MLSHSFSSDVGFKPLGVYGSVNRSHSYIFDTKKLPQLTQLDGERHFGGLFSVETEIWEIIDWTYLNCKIKGSNPITPKNIGSSVNRILTSIFCSLFGDDVRVTGFTTLTVDSERSFSLTSGFQVKNGYTSSVEKYDRNGPILLGLENEVPVPYLIFKRLV